VRIITKEVWLTPVPSNYYGKYWTFVDLVILNPTIIAYLVPYIIEGCDNKNFCHWMSLLLKVDHISYTMGTYAHGITITYRYCEE